MPGFDVIPFNNLDALRQALRDRNVAGFYVEPIQGEAGVEVPSEGYLRAAYDLCRAHNVLFIADEIQTGLFRTGRLLCCDYEGVRPDILVLGKALSGGVYPVSAVLSDDDIMLCLRHGQHGSTYGGNPLAASVSVVALQVLIDERMGENALARGQQFRKAMNDMKARDRGVISEVRGKGLLNAVVVDPKGPVTAMDICMALLRNGVLARPTHENIIRFAPPLIITEEQMRDACDRIADAFQKSVH